MMAQFRDPSLRSALPKSNFAASNSSRFVLFVGNAFRAVPVLCGSFGGAARSRLAIAGECGFDRSQ